MDATQLAVQTLAHSIQLSVAPVFLLSGIGVFLGVLTNRLSRIVDRARPLEDQVKAANVTQVPELRLRLKALSRRARCIHVAITLSTLAALLISVVVALLFASTFVNYNLTSPVAILFIASMLSLVGALVSFLVEVQIALRTVKILHGP